MTPTPTETPLILESTYRKLTPTEVPTPFVTEEVTDVPTAVWEPSQDFTEPPAATYRPVRTPTPLEVPAFTPTPEPTPWTPEPLPTAEISMDEWANQLFNMINEFRAENEIGPLNRNAVLDQSTQQYAEYLISNNLIFSENIHNLKGMPIDRANAISPIWFYVGEVEAHYSVYGGSPQVMMDFWKNSPGHRGALLSFPNPEPDARITELGVGCAVGDFLFPDNTRSPYVVCNGALGILRPTPVPAQ